MVRALSSREIAQVQAQAFADGIPLEDIEYVWEEQEEQIQEVRLILPPGVRSVAELEDLAAQPIEMPLVWTPETDRLFQD